MTTEVWDRNVVYLVYSQTSIKESSLGQRKSGLFRQVTS